MFRLAFFFIQFVIFGLQAKSTERDFVIIVPSYNNENWCVNNVDSILRQNYDKYRIIYINDFSSDETETRVKERLKKFNKDYQIVSFDVDYNKDISDLLKSYRKLINEKKCFFTLVNNKQRCGSLANLYRAIYSCNDSEIIVLVDGDDWLSREDVLKELNTTYSSADVWLTHGRFMEYRNKSSNWSLKIPEEIIKQNEFRKYRLPSHLKTFYSWLFKKIRLEDLLYQEKFFPVTGDMAMMFPMFEMAGERHSYIDNVNYIYNDINSINDFKVNKDLQIKLDDYVRSLPPYQRLDGR